MDLLKNTSKKKKKNSSRADVRPFRSEIQSSVVGRSTVKATETGLSPDGVKVSESRLEQYLNACSPTCHG